MSFKPIASTTFYSKKFPEVRIIVPRKGNVSDDSDCTSDDSSMNLGTRDVNWEDVIIPETESECEYESDNESKKNSVKRFGSRRGSVTCDDNVIVPNTESESESDNEPKKKVVKRSGTRKNATCDKSVTVPETDSECESAKAVPRRKRIKSFHITDRYATHTKIPSKASKKLLFTSPQSKLSGTSQSKGKDVEVDDNNNLSSPCVSPTPSLLGDLGVRPIDPANATMRSHSPDLFDEMDFLEQSPIVLELSQTSNLPQQNEQLKKSEGRILQQVSVNKSKPNESKENFLFDTDLETPSPLKRARGYDSNNFNQLSDSCGKENSCASKQTSKEIVNKQKKRYSCILREKRKSCEKNDRTNMSTHTTPSITRSSLPSSVSLVNGDSQTGHQICHAKGDNGASTKKPGNKETKKKSAPLTNDALKNCGQPSISCGI
ncbi:hypothetical protein ONE63_011435 [Megalurothrips usitatus]|uniref:Uncharacterized protein n=1 Tax=Megalurothrips usitatus TaxID=439358 RepID=A0AAV7X3D7_9NEOP|nr:hypothetical protein ONE63_011435 [Megalurothrips usitatus]